MVNSNFMNMGKAGAGLMKALSPTNVFKASLELGAISALGAYFLGKSPLKWGLIAGGANAAIGLAIGGGAIMGMTACVAAAASDPDHFMQLLSSEQARVGWSFPFTDPYGDYALQRRPSIDSSLEYDPSLFFNERGPQGGPRDFRGIPGYHLGSGWGFWGHGF